MRNIYSKIFFVTAIIFLFTQSMYASIVTKNIEYSADGVMMKGFLAYDDSAKMARPGVMIIHDEMGINDFIKDKAKQLASEGYTAFAVDAFGKHFQPKDQQQAQALAQKYSEDRSLFRKHLPAAYQKFSTMKQVDAKRIIVMGYSLGGIGAMELARSGEPIVGTVLFHSPLSNPNPEDSKKIKSPVLVLHGEDDPLITPDEIDEFKAEMANAKVKLSFVSYPETVHDFTYPNLTNPEADNRYNAEIDKKSWGEFKKFAENNVKPETTINELPLPNRRCQRIPQFSDYTIATKDVITEPLKKINLNTSPNSIDVKKYKKQLKYAEGMKPTFAGKYIVVEWNCGTNCQDHAIVDAKTGKVALIGFQTEDGIEYDVNSKLLIVNPVSIGVEPIKYYLLDKNKLSAICMQK